ncbi:MAG: hypothetical protein ABI647_26370 [Gemmatimonadota bacterium]
MAPFLKRPDFAINVAPLPIELRRLEALLAADPADSCFAALAEALRKMGSLDEAARVASTGTAARPEFLPGHLVRARIMSDVQDWDGAAAEIGLALSLDASHPGALLARDAAEAPRASAVEPTAAPAPSPAKPDLEDAEDLMYDDAIEEAEASVGVNEPLMTESLAMIYRGQGHLAEAVDVLDALVARAPRNAALVARRDAWRAELELAAPRPYDATRSGGRPVREWLASVATAAAPTPPPASSFDAFFQSPTPAAASDGDLAAFQAWLRELER